MAYPQMATRVHTFKGHAGKTQNGEALTNDVVLTNTIKKQITFMSNPYRNKLDMSKRHTAEPAPLFSGGSPLSPLLSNIMLHELDRELERKGQRFIRYADDFSIYAETKTAAQQIGNDIYLFLKNNRPKGAHEFI